MSAKLLPVEPVPQENEEDDPVAAAFDDAPFMEATPAMVQAVAEISDADRAGPFVPHDEVMRRLREHRRDGGALQSSRQVRRFTSVHASFVSAVHLPSLCSASPTTPPPPVLVQPAHEGPA